MVFLFVYDVCWDMTAFVCVCVSYLPGSIPHAVDNKEVGGIGLRVKPMEGKRQWSLQVLVVLVDLHGAAHTGGLHRHHGGVWRGEHTLALGHYQTASLHYCPTVLQSSMLQSPSSL